MLSPHSPSQELEERVWPMWLNSLLLETDELLTAANDPSLRYASRSEVMARLGLDEGDLALLSHISTRLQLIASSIEARDPPKLKRITGRMVREAPKARLLTGDRHVR